MPSTITIGRRGAAPSKVGTAVLGTSRKTEAGAAIPSFITDRRLLLKSPDALARRMVISSRLSQVPGIKRLHTGLTGRSLYPISAGRNLRIVFSIEGNRVIVADVIRRSQLDGLQSVDGFDKAGTR
jgi:hypothetical protein